ncbi:3589_t:CDS:10 [Paraglomus brasilianum]|uniref:Transmembrane 9 superfamily member n=1 Tax=Paraglomus brasilianum TaxID=144538 RepID=A0A9N8ZZ21_9GLOM|nr:3589_t:CDS:10 [Paraglomus brasilianum]
MPSSHSQDFFRHFLIFLFFFSIPVSAFYVPGLSPKTFHDRDDVTLYVNKIFSDKTQLPFAYNDLPFVCVPEDGVKSSWMNLGEVLRGDRIANSVFELKMKEDVDCKILCKKIIKAKDAAWAKQLIKNDYRIEWIVDNLPGATAYQTLPGKKQKRYEVGFKLGQLQEKQESKKDRKAFLNNHYVLKIFYEKKEHDDGNLIVGFEVFPRSIANSADFCPNLDGNAAKQEIGAGESTVTYSYSVEWIEEKEITWGNRWDRYLLNTDAQIHWYSIVNSLIIALFLTAMVAIIMLRTLNRDIALYNEEDLKEDQEDTTGWKLVHGDVFRPPKLGVLLAPLLGSGVQILLMGVSTMVFSILGVLNPSYRGGLVSFALFLFVFSGTFAGYFSSRMYKVFKGTSWKKNAVTTAILVPGFLFGTIFILNLFIWSKHSSSAIPFGTFFALISMWFGISFPLVFIGAYFGFKKKTIEHPVRTNPIPRQIPEQVWYLQPFVSVIVGGLMPFAVIFIELFFILKSIWQDQFYYMFGFLGLVFVILVTTVVEITIVITYFQLCGEDYHWWWRSFFVGGSSSIYIFLYGIFYYNKLQITGFVPSLLYFINSLLACLVYGLFTGTLGFFSTYWFVRKIYSAIKAD